MAYYRVCGYRSHTWSWFKYDDKRLCETVFNALSDEKVKNCEIGVELVLGIQPNGASYILASPEQMDRISLLVRRNISGWPEPAADYASLSPIYFRTQAELEKKVRSLQQKARKKGKGVVRNHEVGQIDNSQANKAFCLGNSTNLSRSNFEHQRLLWKAIQGCVNFSKFCMPTMYWLSSTSLVSLCMNTWNFGPIQERKQNPKVLDMGWTLVPCLSFRDEFREESYKSSHIIVQEHINLSNSGVKRVSFRFGESETRKTQELGAKLKDYFESLLCDRVFLLVHDKERTVNALANLGLPTSSWTIGISKLVREERPPLKANKYEGGVTFQPSDGRRDWARSRARSRSPTRWGDSRWPTLPRRPSSPPRRVVEPDNEVEEGEELEDADDDDDDSTPSGPIVHVIDLQDLFFALSRDPNCRGTHLHTIARKLGIPADPSSVCAGNDCYLLIRAWMSMASGSAVDEQRAERYSCSPDDSLTLQPVDVGEPEASADAEVDINDIDPSTVRSSIRPIKQPGRYVPEGDDESDDEEWFDYCSLQNYAESQKNCQGPCNSKCDGARSRSRASERSDEKRPKNRNPTNRLLRSF